MEVAKGQQPDEKLSFPEGFQKMNRGVSTRVAADTSSLILLQKVGLLHCFLQSYVPVIAAAVYKELGVPGKQGAAELTDLVRHAACRADAADNIAGLGRGESGAILLWKKGLADFLLVDDKKAAHYCKAHAIPFVNSLLMPRILEQNGALTHEQSAAVLLLLVRFGYYSEAVIKRAAAMSAEDLRFFHPVQTVIDASSYS